MILEAAEWIYGEVSADAGVISALAGGAGMVLIFPNNFETLPVLAYAVNQRTSTMDFWDNQPNANDVTVTFDVYTANDADTTPIMQAVDAVMTRLLFTLEFSQPLGDESSKTQHVNMRYSRQGVLQEDVA